MQIEKSSDGVGGGWKLRGVKLVVNGRTLYARDAHRALARGQPPDVARAGLPAQRRRPVAALPVTLDLWDEDSFIYGGNDHGDIEPYDRRKRLALAYVPGTPRPPVGAHA